VAARPVCSPRRPTPWLPQDAGRGDRQSTESEPDVAERVEVALRNLGYEPSVVARVVAALATSRGNVAELIREGLRKLAA
jgi:Holliday junction resolvasome RuvABC DNA-binding subunit